VPSEITLFSKNGDWKADVEAWKNNFLFYKSIGTQVSVYHREQTKNIWGNTVTDWVSKAANTISITDVYKGAGPGAATRSKVCNNSSSCEEKEWAVGVSITLPADSVTDVGGNAILDIDSVTGTVSIVVGGNEVLSRVVSASSIISDSSLW